MTRVSLPAALPVAFPVAAAQAGPPALATRPRLYPRSVGPYHAIIRAGILTEHDPAELVEGPLVRPMPRSPEHDAAAHALSKRL